MEGTGKCAEVWSWHGCSGKWFQGKFCIHHIEVIDIYIYISIDKYII